MFQIGDGRQLENMFNLAEENMKILVWSYNDKCFLTITDKQNINMLSINLMKPTVETTNKLNITKMNLTLWIHRFIGMKLKKPQNKLQDIQFLKLIKIY